MDLYSAFIVGSHSRHLGMVHTVFICKLHCTCLYLVSVRQTAPPLTDCRAE